MLVWVSSPRLGVGWLDFPLFARSLDRRGGVWGKKTLWLALPGLVTRQDGEGGGGDGVVAIASQEFSCFCIYPCRIRVFHITPFFELSVVLLTTHAIGLYEVTKKISAL